MEEKKYNWNELIDLLDNRYNHYHMNAPYPMDELTFDEIIDFGEISDNVYENPIITSLVLNEGKSLLNEAEYATFPIDTTINYVSNALNIPMRMFKKGKKEGIGEWCIMVKAFNEDEVKENITKAMHLCGYYLADGRIYKGDNRFIILRYEPKYIDEGTRIVRECQFLYHLSPLKYKEKILKNGFVPRCKNGRFNYPDRCYFFMDNMPKNTILSWIPIFQKATKNRKNISHCLYTIDVSKINDNVVFYLDPNLKGGCYTADNISPNVIVNVEDVLYSVTKNND